MTDNSTKDEDDDPLGECFFCNEHGCSDYFRNCISENRIYFCSPDHRNYHSQSYEEDKGHPQSFCCPYTIRSRGGVGRVLIANRTIQPGELIFREAPIMIGPHHETRPICLACGSGHVNGDYVCPSCYLPLCSETCYTSLESLHAKFECRVFSSRPKRIVKNFEEPHPLYQCILPLRCLLLQTDESWVERLLRVMMDHLEDRPKDIHWAANQKNIVEYLQESQGLPFTSEEINHVIGVLDVNAFDLSSSGRGLYPLSAIMSHSCVSNTKYIIRKRDHVVECRATVRIYPGEELTDHYVSPLQGTAVRSQCLRDGWYFDCKCLRCMDPTEFQTHMSSFLCDKCDGGYILHPPQGTDWLCSSCDKISTLPHAKICEDLSERLEKCSRTIPELESLLNECSNARLSPTHYLVLSLKRYLIYAYKNTSLNKNIIHRIRGYCESLLSVADVVTPGLTKERGLTLYELKRLKLYELERTPHPDIEALRATSRSLQHVMECLEHEDDDSFQASIREEAKVKLNQLNEGLTLLKLMMSSKSSIRE
eukprot:TRINITY_DN5617_c0_g1_i1.p1 TRINITY_DN5617_c0_g1~~TRINITY_DN5617_c0_g1_i1.p1  ORF type:complete len:550 (+),score=73.83 TRINITY_DN5617_c0_g1_i1:42-1652(+)